MTKKKIILTIEIEIPDHITNEQLTASMNEIRYSIYDQLIDDGVFYVKMEYKIEDV